MLSYRWIEEKEDIERLSPIFEQFGWTPLNYPFAKALVAEDETGKIVGFNVLQMVVRAEPMWVERSHRGKDSGVAAELASQMSTYLQEMGCRYWTIKTDSPSVAKLCLKNGMVKSSMDFFEGGV